MEPYSGIYRAQVQISLSSTNSKLPSTKPHQHADQRRDDQSRADVSLLYTAEAKPPASGSYKYLSETAGKAVGQIRAKWHSSTRNNKQQNTGALTFAQASAAVLMYGGAGT